MTTSSPNPAAGQRPRLLHPFARPAARTEDFLTIASASGSEVFDSSGKRYLDALASLWYCAIGHGRGEIGEAVVSQMTQLDAFHLFDRFTNAPADALADRISSYAPMDDARVFFTSGGSEAVETAIKLARLAQVAAGHPERRVVISRQPSYHGVTYAAMAATGLPPNREGFGPLPPEIVQVPHDSLEAARAAVAQYEGRVAAIIAEPVVGAGGVYPPVEGYLQGLRELCDQAGALLILDEVICAFGRMGTWFAAEHFGVVPDLVTFAKGVTSGYIPLGGVVVGPAVHDPLEADESLYLRHGNTYSGHPVACAAAMANLDIMERESLLDRAPGIAAVLGKGLGTLVDGERVTSVRGAQGVWALGLGEGVDASALREKMLDRGVIARPIGTSTVAFCPPLVVTDTEMGEIVDRTGEAISDLP